MSRIRSFATTAALALGLLASCGGHSGGGAAAPSDLKVAALQGGAHLTWKDNSSDEAQFMIERKVGGGAFQTLSTVPFNTTQYHDAPVTTGTSYTYRVMAMDGKGVHSAASNEVAFTAP